MKDNVSNRIYGTMFGVAIGDALGAPLEFMSAEGIRLRHGTVREMLGGGWLNVKPGEVTDDTQMTLAVAHGICDAPTDPVPAIGSNFIRWYRSGPKDVGATCSTAIRNAFSAARKKEKPTNADWKRASLATHNALGGRSAGNGTLMRTAYVGLYYENEKDIIQNARAISQMTHYDEETAVDCAVYSMAIRRMVDTSSQSIRLETLIHYTSTYCKGRYNYERLSSESFNPNPSGYVVDSFAAALHCIFTTSSFEDALVKAINLGGDADTIGAITGGLAGALYGYDAIPERWRKQLDPRTRLDIEALCAIAASGKCFSILDNNK